MRKNVVICVVTLAGAAAFLACDKSSPTDPGDDCIPRPTASLTHAITPEIQELDLNPVMVTASGACVADARVRIEHPRPQARNRRVAY